MVPPAGSKRWARRQNQGHEPVRVAQTILGSSNGDVRFTPKAATAVGGRRVLYGPIPEVGASIRSLRRPQMMRQGPLTVLDECLSPDTAVDQLNRDAK